MSLGNARIGQSRLFALDEHVPGSHVQDSVAGRAEPLGFIQADALMSRALDGEARRAAGGHDAMRVHAASKGEENGKEDGSHKTQDGAIRRHSQC